MTEQQLNESVSGDYSVFPFGATSWELIGAREISQPTDAYEELQYRFEVRDVGAFNNARIQMIGEFVKFELPIVFENGNWKTNTVVGFVKSVSMNKGEFKNGYISGVAVADLMQN